VVPRILNGEDDPTMINDTSIVLIPKVDKPEELGQFWPINLCNVVYNAFMPDNIIIAYECLHFMKKKRHERIYFVL
jgi:hypothetical protein